LWIGVRPDRRRRGIGAALYAGAEAHARAVGVQRLTVEVDDDPAGRRFVETRGFERISAEIVSSLDPRLTDLSEIDAFLAATLPAGFELKTLRAMTERGAELAAFYDTAEAWPPGGNESSRISPDELWRFTFERPELSWDCSFVIVDERSRLVSLATLVVDRAAGRAENDWTATLPDLRGRGLARLVKLATIRWARNAGIREIVTANDDDNVPMLALNKRLGYRRLYEQVELARELGGFGEIQSVPPGRAARPWQLPQSRPYLRIWTLPASSPGNEHRDPATSGIPPNPPSPLAGRLSARARAAPGP
jgi:GNAT superfamily N-acetyltransferase